MAIKDQLHGATDNVADKVHKSIDATTEALTEAEARIRARAGHANESLHEGARQIHDKSEAAVECVTSYVKSNPILAVGIAFVAGSLLASFIRRH